jgi:hypothetical protein
MTVPVIRPVVELCATAKDASEKHTAATANRENRKQSGAVVNMTCIETV